ncbi:MAG: hypothetical protein FD180_4593 [Planctomycetota bacterium]|nr:MAG: hypothetical protein FD180_4593 [Planctomycetota bacterium]
MADAAEAGAAADAVETRDRFGLTWRPALAAGILAARDRVDLIEVIADDWFGRSEGRALRTLAAQIPVSIHGVGLGPASATPSDRKRIDALARLVGSVEPDAWSEHLAFTRAAGCEIGHLASPPRTCETVEGAARNLRRLASAVASRPTVENIATLAEPPGSAMSEAAWIAAILEEADADLLLDLHNLHANASNFRYDPFAFLDAIPAKRIRAIHLAGGRFVGPPGGKRILDDHRHAVPDPVFGLLEEVGARVPHALDVVLERDDARPPLEHLLGELDLARSALARGRARRASRPEPARAPLPPPSGRASEAEALLAQIYTDPAALARFLENPPGPIDRLGLRLAAESFSRKRERKFH